MNSPVLFRRLSGGLIATALVIGPLNYASTRFGGAWILIALIGLAALCWSVSLVVEQRVPPAPVTLLLGLGALAGSALFWLSSASQPTTPAEFTRAHFARALSRWPHSMAHFDLASTIALHAGFGFALWIVADLARDRAWLFLFSSVMVSAAVVVAVIALLQNITHASGIFWQAEGRLPGKFWGTFFHHTSAGSYLNTVWPLAAGLAVNMRQSISSNRTTKAASIAAAVAFVILIAAHATHISRFPQFVALAVLPFLTWNLLRKKNFQPGRWAFFIPLGIAAIVLSAGRTGEIMQRWHLVDFSTPKTVRPVPPESEWPALVRADLLIPNLYNAGSWGDRGEAQRTAWRAIAARPLTGHGPGNWSGAASHSSSDPYVRSFYLYLQFAHEDFLQTWAEWGVAGFFSLLVLLPGAVIAVCAIPPIADPAVAAIAVCAATALAIVLGQSLLDFPLQIPAVALNATVLAGLCWSTVNRLRPPVSSLSITA